MRLLYDFDSTIADTQQMRLDAVNQEFGTNYTKSYFTAWKDDDLFPKEVLEYMWGPHVFLDTELQMNAQPNDGAIEGIKELHKNGHTGIVVSDRPMMLYDVTRAWLNSYGLDYVPLIFTKSVAMTNVKGDAVQTKSQIAYLHKLTHAIEDSPHHAEALAGRDYINSVYLMDMPYNQVVQEHDKIIRVPDFKTAVQMVLMSAKVGY